jgi:DNA-binding transcriptional LysR family regulator
MKLEDMRIFASVAAARSFTAAGRALGLPKQTLSRRVAALEETLGVRLLHRTTRRLHLSEVGAAYAERCAEVIRLAEEANRSVTDAGEAPRGTLRVSADPVFGEAFLGGVVLEFARRWPDVQVEVMLTRRRVDLIEEGFDVAFRVGRVDDAALTATRLGPARIRYCASPRYLARRGAPKTPEDLTSHACILVVSEGGPVRWPFQVNKREVMLTVSGRLRFNSFALAHAAALAGLGIAIFPEFACAQDIRRKRLVPVLEDCIGEVGAVWLVHPRHKYLTARVRAFAELVGERLARNPPWEQAGTMDRPAPRQPPGSRRSSRVG